MVLPPTRGNLDGVEDRGLRRKRLPGAVGMPVGAGILAPERLVVLLLVGDAEDLGMAGQGVLAGDRIVVGRGELAEPAAESDLLLGCQELVADDEEPVGIDPGLVQLAEQIVADRLAADRRR